MDRSKGISSKLENRPVLSITISKDGKLIASAGNDRKISLREILQV